MYPTPIIKLSVGGSVAGEDVWTNGLTLTPNNQLGSAEDAFLALTPQQFTTAVNAFYATGPFSMSQYNTVEWIKLALIGRDGKYLRDAKIYDYPTPRPGTGSFAVSPHDTLVISELTGRRGGWRDVDVFTFRRASALFHRQREESSLPTLRLFLLRLRPTSRLSTQSVQLRFLVESRFALLPMSVKVGSGA